MKITINKGFDGELILSFESSQEICINNFKDNKTSIYCGVTKELSKNEFKRIMDLFIEEFNKLNL